MLMGLQQRACSHRNQLPAPVDVFLIRLFTLHRMGWLQDTALGLSLGQWLLNALSSAPLHPLYPISRGSMHCTACATHLPTPSPGLVSLLCLWLCPQPP